MPSHTLCRAAPSPAESNEAGQCSAEAFNASSPIGASDQPVGGRSHLAGKDKLQRCHKYSCSPKHIYFGRLLQELGQQLCLMQ